MAPPPVSRAGSGSLHEVNDLERCRASDAGASKELGKLPLSLLREDDDEYTFSDDAEDDTIGAEEQEEEDS